jgi:hypothetical protein
VENLICPYLVCQLSCHPLIDCLRFKFQQFFVVVNFAFCLLFKITICVKYLVHGIMVRGGKTNYSVHNSKTCGKVLSSISCSSCSIVLYIFVDEREMNTVKRLKIFLKLKEVMAHLLLVTCQFFCQSSPAAIE